MNKLSNGVYKRLLAQAEEARDLKLTKLANSVLSAIGPSPCDEEALIFSYAELEENVQRSLWKIAIDIVAYHDMPKADIQKVELAVNDLTNKVLSTIENSLNSLNKVGPNEPDLPGEYK